MLGHPCTLVYIGVLLFVGCSVRAVVNIVHFIIAVSCKARKGAVIGFCPGIHFYTHNIGIVIIAVASVLIAGKI